MRKWAIAIYLRITILKSVSSMKLHRYLGVSQPTISFMMTAFVKRGQDLFKLLQ